MSRIRPPREPPLTPTDSVLRTSGAPATPVDGTSLILARPAPKQRTSFLTCVRGPTLQADPQAAESPTLTCSIALWVPSASLTLVPAAKLLQREPAPGLARGLAAALAEPPAVPPPPPP